MRKIQISIQRSVAEFAIIVLGVLAAFAVENWKESHAESILEAQYLERLVSDVTFDVERLQFTINLAEQKNQALRTVRSWSSDSDRPELLIKGLRRAIYLGWSLPALNTATIEDLNSTGRLGLIEDTDLRRAILDYYRDMNNVRERLERRMTPFPTYIYSIVVPELLSDDEAEYAAALTECQATCKMTVNAAETGEFQRLVSAEANYGRMIESLLSVFIEQAREMQNRLRAATKSD